MGRMRDCGKVLVFTVSFLFVKKIKEMLKKKQQNPENLVL